MSSTPGKSFFNDFLDDYFAECEEHLTAARSSLVSFSPSDASQIPGESAFNELLRNFHSLKGLSAMVGLDEATQLAHHIEDYLRELKQRDAIVCREGFDRVLTAISAIENVLEARRKSEAPPDINAVLLQLESSTREVRTKPASLIDTSSPRNWRFKFKPSIELATRGITVSTVRDRLRAIGQIMNASPRVLEDGGVAFEFVVATPVPEAEFEDLISEGIEYSALTEDMPVELQDTRPVATSVSAGVGTHNVIRVEMSRLDDLMRLVGDLVVSRFRLDQAIDSTDSTHSWRQVQEINLSMERQMRDLREAVMRVRMVPIGQVFERMRFVVRGLERETGKNVKVQIQGQETELDKVIVEAMMDPLLHLVRNALSHGFESVDERRAAGKSTTGTLRLSALTAGDTVLINVEDDGRGIDLDKIRQRAHSRGLIGMDESLDDPKRLLEIISAPGFTTREQADLASGRGVGMSAVQATVSELGGAMSMETTRGQGTRFAIRLPLTLLIADSLLVTVAQQSFAVPQSAVQEVLSAESASVRVLENNEVVPFRGGVLPILRLRNFFGFAGTGPERMHLLVVGHGNSPLGLVVDRITGQREIVLRVAKDPLLKAPGVVGATELGDGRPVLILDPQSLIRAARERSMLDIRHD
jgi:two-component system chemotaxis sensor kinase CheA